MKLFRSADSGHQVIVDIYLPDEFFGESAFLKLPCASEQALALEDGKLMAWDAQIIESIVMNRPRLGLALWQVQIQRTLELARRIESLSAGTTLRQVARALIRFSERMGTARSDGSVHMSPLTHELLSQYVVTSREIVTASMNQLRSMGYLQYSRSGIVVFRAALQKWLRAENGLAPSRSLATTPGMALESGSR